MSAIKRFDVIRFTFDDGRQAITYPDYRSHFFSGSDGHHIPMADHLYRFN